MEVYQIAGTPDKTGWNQIHILPMKDQYPQAGEAILLFTAPVSDQDGNALGRELLARFTEKYFLDNQKSRLNALRQTLAVLAQEKPLYEAAKYLDLTAIAVVNRPPFQWLGVIGQGEIWLYRNGELQLLVPTQPDKKVTVISAQMAPDDILIIGSRLFFQIIPKATLAASLNSQDLRRTQEILSPLIYQQAKGQLAAAILRCQAPTETKLAEEKETSPFPTLPTTQTHFPRWHLPQLKLPHIKLKLPYFRPQIPPAGIKIRSNYPPSHQQLWRGLAIGFLILLSASLIWGWQRQRRIHQQRLVAAKINQAAGLMNKAQGIRQLDTDKSLALAKKALSTTEDGLKIDPRNPELKKLHQELKKLITISGGQQITPDLFFDLRVIADNVSAQNWDFDGHYFYILDQQGRLLRLEKDSKNSQIISRDPLLKRLIGVAVSNGQVYGWNQQGIYHLTKGEFKEARSSTIEAGDPLAGWGGNIYQVANQQKKILKYTAGKGKLAKPQPWLKTTAKIHWPVTGLAINGSLWLLEKDGQIDRFYAGRQDNFPSQPPSRQACFLSTSNHTPYLAFWSREKKTLVVLNKKGRLVLRLPLKIDEVRGVMLADGGKKAFLLTKNKILTTSLSW